MSQNERHSCPRTSMMAVESQRKTNLDCCGTPHPNVQTPPLLLAESQEGRVETENYQAWCLPPSPQKNNSTMIACAWGGSTKPTLQRLCNLNIYSLHASQVSTTSNKRTQISQYSTVPPEMLITAVWDPLSILDNWVWTSERGCTNTKNWTHSQFSENWRTPVPWDNLQTCMWPFFILQMYYIQLLS